jgi:hypothetical protein
MIRAIHLLVVFALGPLKAEMAFGGPQLGSAYPEIAVAELGHTNGPRMLFPRDGSADVLTVCISGFKDGQELPPLDQEARVNLEQSKAFVFLFTDGPSKLLAEHYAQYKNTVFYFRGLLPPEHVEAFGLGGFPERGTVAILVYTQGILVDFQTTPLPRLWESIKGLNCKERARMARTLEAKAPQQPLLFSRTSPFTNLSTCIEHAQKEKKAILLITGRRDLRFKSLWDQYCQATAKLTGLPPQTPEKYLFCVLEMNKPLQDTSGKLLQPGVREFEEFNHGVFGRYYIRVVSPAVTLLDCSGKRLSTFMPLDNSQVEVLSFLAGLDLK